MCQDYQSSVGADEALAGHIESPELEAGLAVGALRVTHHQPGQWHGVSEVEILLYYILYIYNIYYMLNVYIINIVTKR